MDGNLPPFLQHPFVSLEKESDTTPEMGRRRPNSMNESVTTDESMAVAGRGMDRRGPNSPAAAVAGRKQEEEDRPEDALQDLTAFRDVTGACFHRNRAVCGLRCAHGHQYGSEGFEACGRMNQSKRRNHAR
ncbi:hypothetical protein AXF42_Ash018840 [Apostasia shenzhenica]|uniref:Uncharacterized protein n=1 Tax=Apostasia shenzhenica TaxID=1088818 RepID=A0A2I0B193_9ASPA|nr:hypothetical protein AXF42_Ash018840 [Apostasia shenzhenica]